MPASVLMHGEPRLLNRAETVRAPEPLNAHALVRKARRKLPFVRQRGVPVLVTDSVSWQHEHERQASAHAPDVRLNSPSRAS